MSTHHCSHWWAKSRIKTVIIFVFCVKEYHFPSVSKFTRLGDWDVPVKQGLWGHLASMGPQYQDHLPTWAVTAAHWLASRRAVLRGWGHCSCPNGVPELSWCSHFCWPVTLS